MKRILLTVFCLLFIASCKTVITPARHHPLQKHTEASQDTIKIPTQPQQAKKPPVQKNEFIYPVYTILGIIGVTLVVCIILRHKK